MHYVLYCELISCKMRFIYYVVDRKKNSFFKIYSQIFTIFQLNFLIPQNNIKYLLNIIYNFHFHQNLQIIHIF